MRKRFGRPVPTFSDDEVGGPIRAIRLPREDNGMDTVYASVAARDAMETESAEAARKRALGDAIRAWMASLVFWFAVLYLAVYFLRGQ